jgi:hypothetical protein
MIRQDVGSRLAGQKAEQLDEFLVKGQVVAGTNITIQDVSGNNIRISANISANESGILDGISAETKDFKTPVNGDIAFEQHYSFNSNNGIHYNDLKIINIYHNFNLAEPNNFTYEAYVVRTAYDVYITMSPYLVDARIEVVGVTANIARAYIYKPSININSNLAQSTNGIQWQNSYEQDTHNGTRKVVIELFKTDSLIHANS